MSLESIPPQIKDKFIYIIIYREPIKYALLCALCYYTERGHKVTVCEDADFCIEDSTGRIPVITRLSAGLGIYDIATVIRSQILDGYSLSRIGKLSRTYGRDRVRITFCMGIAKCVDYSLSELINALKQAVPNLAARFEKALEKEETKWEIQTYEQELTKREKETEIELATELYRQGYSIYKIAKMLGKSQATVISYLKRAGALPLEDRVCPKCGGYSVVKIFDFNYCVRCKQRTDKVHM